MRHALVLLLLGTALLAGEDLVEPRRIVTEAGGTLYRYAERRVLVVRGSPKEMGLAHGRLLKEEIKANVNAFLHEWAIRSRGGSRDEFKAIWKRIEPFIPARYHAELEGIAEGSGVPLEDLQLLHAIPSRYHCTGAAALPTVTKDKKVYHTRSLDYALDIGETTRPQTNSLLYVVVPKDGIPHAVVTWAGFIGCVTGMNLDGLAVGEMGSRSKDETFDGLPMIFLLREVLSRAHNVGEAKEIWRKAPRTCGYNFILSDSNEICAVESNRSRIRFFRAGEDGDGDGPHYGIDGIVRRCNHFVDRELAATQRGVYDPRESALSSWTAYQRQGDFLKGRRGRIDAATMIEMLRGYPVTHPCLHQAVMCPTDRVMWVSQARDPRVDPLAGAQNQAFYRYDLRALVAGTPAPARRLSVDRPVTKGVETGQVEETRRIEGSLGHEPQRFDFRLEELRNLGEVTIFKLTYPSPGPSLHRENETVHAEYFRPAGKGPFPSVIVLHILDGRFYVARLVANAMAQKGVAALFIKLPYYGERRPKEGVDLDAIDLPDAVNAVRQGVRDIRRGAAWLRHRPEVDRKRVGIVGISLGSFLAQLAAGADGGFDRCAFVLGGGSLVEAIYSGSRETRKIAKVLGARGWTKERVAAAFSDIEPGAVAKGVAKGGVLMINCREDEIVPPQSTRRYWERLGKPEIVWYDGGHYALKGHIFEVLNRLTGHFER